MVTLIVHRDDLLHITRDAFFIIAHGGAFIIFRQLILRLLLHLG